MSKLLADLALSLAVVPAAGAHVGGGTPLRTCSGHAHVGSARTAYFAIVRRHATPYRSPGEHPLAHFHRRNVNGARTVFSIRSAVLDASCRPAWFRVQLPIKPNGVVGYVAARAVVVGAVHTRLQVDLSRRVLTLLKFGRPILRTRVSIGSPGTPTPTRAGRSPCTARTAPT